MTLTEEEFENNITPIEVVGNLLLFLLVFGMSATVKVENLASQLKNKNAILTGVFLQFFVLPALGFFAVKFLTMEDSMGITLLVVTSSPGGSYSNWWCSMFNADLALSVTMTTISTLLSVIMLPLNLMIYTNLAFDADVVESLDWVSLFIALTIVILAIGLGMLCSAKIKWPRFHSLANMLGNLAGISLVIFSFAMTSSDAEADLAGREWEFYVGVAAPCVLGLAIANLMTSCFKLLKPERVTVSVECCYQNVGIATSVALTMFRGDDLAQALGVPIYYGIVEAGVLGVYCICAWKAGWTKAPKNENCCKVIYTSYETPEKGSVAPTSDTEVSESSKAENNDTVEAAEEKETSEKENLV